jgi:hypothetical protein
MCEFAVETSIISVLLMAKLAAAAPLEARQNCLVNIQLQIYSDTFVQGKI